MKNYKRIFTFLLAALIFTPQYAQTSDSNNKSPDEGVFFNLYDGAQMSEIKKEDFVASNGSPHVQKSVGKQIVPLLAIAIAYQGPYFYFIGDNFKHKYIYVGSDAIFNLNKLFINSNEGFWRINAFVGPGLMYNNFYKKMNFCLNGGIINEFRVKNNWRLKFKVSAIAGQNIYQKDSDIMPNLSLGLSEKINLYFEV